MAYYRAVTIDKTYVPSTQSNFPVLINGTYSYLKTVANGGSVQNSSGYDIGFYSDAALTTKLKWHRVKYDATTGEIIFNVRIPSLSSSSNTVIYLGYGDSSITTDQSDSANTYSNSYRGFYPLNDNAANTTVTDAVGISNGTNNANTSTKTATGKIGSGLLYNGSSDFTSIAQNLSSYNKLTISFWLSWDSFANNDKLAMEFTANGADTDGGFYIDLNSNGGGCGAAGTVDFMIGGSGTSYSLATIARTSAATFHKWDIVFDKSKSSAEVDAIYIDGSSVSLTQTSCNANHANNFANSTLYLMSRSGAALFGAGILNFFSISNDTRTADWITTEYNTQSGTVTFYSVGSEVNTVSQRFPAMMLNFI